MLRSVAGCLVALLALPVGVAAPVPKEAPKPTGILVLDNCDPLYRGKDKYEDNLTFLDGSGKNLFRASGLNNCESIGSNRMIAPDPARKCVWVIENVGNRLRRFDLTGRETLTIEGVKGSAIAVDAETGNVWALVGPGQIGMGNVVVYDEKGNEVASHPITGWDIVYDKKAKAFWIADKKLTKIIAATGKVVFTAAVAPWCASSVDVDPKTGCAWVAVREHPDVPNSANRLLKFDPDGKELVAVELGKDSPARVSVDAKDGSVWVACFGANVARYTSAGKVDVVTPVHALAVQVDPAGGCAWVVTPEETQQLDAKGKMLNRAKHAGNTTMAWIAALE